MQPAEFFLLPQRNLYLTFAANFIPTTSQSQLGGHRESLSDPGHDSGDKVVAQPNTLTTATLLRQPRRIILVEMFYLVIFSNRNLSTAWHSWV